MTHISSIPECAETALLVSCLKPDLTFLNTVANVGGRTWACRIETQFYTPQGFMRASDLHLGFTLYDDARRFGSTVAEISEIVSKRAPGTRSFSRVGSEIVCSGCQKWIAVTQFELEYADNPREMLRLCTTKEIFRNSTKTYMVPPVWNVHKYREIIEVERRNKESVEAIEITSRPEMRSFLIGEQMIPVPNPNL